MPACIFPLDPDKGRLVGFTGGRGWINSRRSRCCSLPGLGSWGRTRGIGKSSRTGLLSSAFGTLGRKIFGGWVSSPTQ